MMILKNRRKRFDIMSNEFDIPEPPTNGYKTITADPPWSYGDNLPGDEIRGSESHYNTMNWEDVANMGHIIDNISADESHLYLWSTHSHLREAFNVMNGWGFDYKTILTWSKTTNGTDPGEAPHNWDEAKDIKPRMGMGYHYYRANTEFLLFGTKGNKQCDKNNIFDIFFAPRTEHSSKPELAYDIIEEQSEGPALELFARERKDRDLDWSYWGDEIE